MNTDRLIREIRRLWKEDPLSLELADLHMRRGGLEERHGDVYAALWCYVFANTAYNEAGAHDRAFDAVLAFDRAREINTFARWDDTRLPRHDMAKMYALARLKKYDAGIPREGSILKEALDTGVVKQAETGVLLPGDHPPRIPLYSPPPLWPLCEECGARVHADPCGKWRLRRVRAVCKVCHGTGWQDGYGVTPQDIEAWRERVLPVPGENPLVT